MAVVAVDALNLRGGPGIEYPLVAQAAAGERLPILGRNATGTWWLIERDDIEGWVYGQLVTTQGDVASAPAVKIYETTITIPTYPHASFTEEIYDPRFGWTYQRLDWAAYDAAGVRPEARTYELVVLENEFLRITLLPELGGRIYQAIFKPTGSNEFYQNLVIKPSPWGPAEQQGWLAAGGMEWGLPVEEHGYAWRDSWGYTILPLSQSSAGVTVFMRDAGHLRAEVDVLLRAGEAAFTIRPRIVNPTNEVVAYKFWLDAMLAPGPGNSPGPELRFLFPTNEMTVHSRGEEALPLEGQAMSWPSHAGVDYSRLGNWNRWLGLFERPAAHGPFAGVYDEAQDEGMVRVFPPTAAGGSKGFGLGWINRTDPSIYTDDGSSYVELHGGVAPTFWDQAVLGPVETYSWEETWYPVAGIGGVSYADVSGAIHLKQVDNGILVGIHVVRRLSGRLLLTMDDQPVVDEAVVLSPSEPYRRVLTPDGVRSGPHMAVTLFDDRSVPVLHYEQELP